MPPTLWDQPGMLSSGWSDMVCLLRWRTSPHSSEVIETKSTLARDLTAAAHRLEVDC